MITFRIFNFFLYLYLIIFFVTSCNYNSKEIFRFSINHNKVISEIIFYSDSTFTNKTNEDNSTIYSGNWKFINIKDSIIETSIYSEGLNIYTLTTTTLYKISNDTLIKMN